MKKFLTWATMFALVVGFSACGGGDDETTPPGSGDGGQGSNPTPEVPVAPKYVNQATSKNGLTIAATHNFVEVSAEAAPATIEFAVFNKDGQDVTANASVYIIEGSSSTKLASQKFTPETTGTYQFWASYGTENTKADAVLSVTAVSDIPAVPADENPASKDFKRRVLIVQGTGVTCQYCPNAITALHNFFNNATNKDKAVLMALHTFTSGDPLYSAAAEKLRIQAGISSYPTLKLNFDNNYLGFGLNIDGFNSFLNNSIPEICNEGSESAIAVATSYNEETGVISVSTNVKCDNPGEYKVSVALVQDNVFFQQSGTTDVNLWVHEAGVKDIAPASGNGFALNNG
ncbi:MAG: hypothetical protein J6U65_03585, partial [Bacteroidaceae bacterium]|nr:hypothetical protein [Bacteroidaceae bacterium]